MGCAQSHRLGGPSVPPMAYPAVAELTLPSSETPWASYTFPDCDCAGEKKVRIELSPLPVCLSPFSSDGEELGALKNRRLALCSLAGVSCRLRQAPSQKQSRVCGYPGGSASTQEAGNPEEDLE